MTVHSSDCNGVRLAESRRMFQRQWRIETDSISNITVRMTMSMRASVSRQRNPQHLVRLSEQKRMALSAMSNIRKRWQQKNASRALLNASSCTLEFNIDNAAILRQRALSKARCGYFREAIALFNRLLQSNPDSARDYNNRGLVHFQSGNMEAALADYNQALHLNPYLDGAYNNRANYYAAAGSFLEAVLDYDAALDLNPDNIRAWINQGITFRDLQMYDRALESLDIALTMGLLTSHVYAERGRTYHLRGDWNCAIADYQRALACINDPDAIATGNTYRLQHQVNTWIEDLLSPIESLSEGF